jgi:hypothetical protein
VSKTPPLHGVMLDVHGPGLALYCHHHSLCNILNQHQNMLKRLNHNNFSCRMLQIPRNKLKYVSTFRSRSCIIFFGTDDSSRCGYSCFDGAASSIRVAKFLYCRFEKCYLNTGFNFCLYKCFALYVLWYEYRIRSRNSLLTRSRISFLSGAGTAYKWHSNLSPHRRTPRLRVRPGSRGLTSPPPPDISFPYF